MNVHQVFFNFDLFFFQINRSYISAFVLGIRDRHHDNIMFHSEEGWIFHIDFGHILGDVVTMDTGDFAITPEFKRTLGPELWIEFVNYAVKAFLCIRKHAEKVISFVESLMASLPRPNGAITVGDFLRRILMLNGNSDLNGVDQNRAGSVIRGKIDGAPNNFNTKFKNWTHSKAIAYKEFSSDSKS